MTAAAIGRLVHHSVIIELNIPSCRVEEARKRQEAEGQAAGERLEMEKPGRRVEQAGQMLNLLAGLGVDSLDLTRTGIDGRKRGYRAAQSVEALRREMPSLVRPAAQWRHK